MKLVYIRRTVDTLKQFFKLKITVVNDTTLRVYKEV